VQQLNRQPNRKTAKYDLLAQTGCLFQPIAAEMLGPLNESSVAFFSELSRKIVSISGDNFLNFYIFFIVYHVILFCSVPLSSTASSTIEMSYCDCNCEKLIFKMTYYL